jgi:hypothetical protein
MRSVKTIVRAGLAAVAAAIILTTTAAPAQADEVSSMCGSIAGTYAENNVISLCADIIWWDADPEGDLTLKSQVAFDPGTTSATNCKVTMYAEFDKPGATVWKSPKNTQSCKWALDHKGQNQSIRHQTTKTSAWWVKAHACIDFYYNDSTTSGLQKCMVGNWEDNPQFT